MIMASNILSALFSKEVTTSYTGRVVAKTKDKLVVQIGQRRMLIDTTGETQYTVGQLVTITDVQGKKSVAFTDRLCTTKRKRVIHT